jgi:hypothetical protein
MDLEDLRFLIDADAMEPVLIQQNRGDIRRMIDKTPPRDQGEISEWWSNNKSYVSRVVNEKLNQGNENDQEAEQAEEAREIEEFDEDAEVNAKEDSSKDTE